MATEPEKTSTFQRIADGLVNLGGFPLAKFADPAFVTSFYQRNLTSSSQSNTSQMSYKTPSTQLMDPQEALVILSRTAHKLFRTTACLRYTYHGEGMGHTDLKGCTLTVTLPNGDSRQYTTATVYYKKVEAKSAAAMVALKNSVIEFMHGDKTSQVNVSDNYSKPVEGSDRTTIALGKRRASPPPRSKPPPEPVHGSTNISSAASAYHTPPNSKPSSSSSSSSSSKPPPFPSSKSSSSSNNPRPVSSSKPSSSSSRHPHMSSNRPSSSSNRPLPPLNRELPTGPRKKLSSASHRPPPINKPPSHIPPDTIDLIEEGCRKAHGDAVSPEWYQMEAFDHPGYFGCLLKIRIDSKLVGLYASECSYPTFNRAKWECALLATQQDVLDFIQNGGVMMNPISAAHSLGMTSANHCSELLHDKQVVMTGQSFFDSLPRTPNDIFETNIRAKEDPISFITRQVDSLRDPQFSLSFIWISPPEYSSSSMYGAMLRLERHTEGKQTTIYMVEPRFQRRKDARSAVYHLAVSRGLHALIQEAAERNLVCSNGTGDSLETLSDELLSKAEEKFASLNAEFRKIFSTDMIPHVFKHENQQGWSAKLNIRLPSKEKQSWRARSKYKTEKDAKYAVILLAWEQGALRFLQTASPKSSIIAGEPIISLDPPTPPQPQPQPQLQSIETRAPRARSPPLSIHRDSSLTIVQTPPSKPTHSSSSSNNKRPRSSLALSQHETLDHQPKRVRTESLSIAESLRITTISYIPTPSLTKLNDFCDERKIPKPHFSSETVADGTLNERKHRVRLFLHGQMFELPRLFGTLEEGYEQLSVQVLAHLKAIQS